MNKRTWFWITAAAAVACVVVGILGWVDLNVEFGFWVPSFTGAISALFLLPGFGLSLGVDAVLLGLRRTPTMRVAEVVLLPAVIATAAGLLLTGLSEQLIELDFALWPVGILLAVATTIVIGVGNAARSQPADLAVRAFEPQVPPEPPTVPAG
jgi:hypothetical protein